MKVNALPRKILVSDLERGARVVNGIIIPDDNGKSSGIRPRWGKVHSVGDGIDEIDVGQWILVEHGRWTRMFEIKDKEGTKIQLWGVDPESAILVSDELPEDEVVTFSKWD
jgi:co-chaperonin GroES (HSP10)